MFSIGVLPSDLLRDSFPTPFHSIFVKVADCRYLYDFCVQMSWIVCFFTVNQHVTNYNATLLPSAAKFSMFTL